MIQFQKYPIYIVYSNNSQMGTWRMEDSFADDAHMENWTKTTLRALNEISDDKYQPMYRQEAAKYESFVKNQLDKIAATHIGKILLVQFNPSIKTYIIPDPNIPSFVKDHRRYYAYALTSEILSGKQGGGIRIHINADGETGVFDETLFHEMIHAARYANRLNSPREILSRALGFISSEEFIASQMSNIYRSCRGYSQLSLNYVDTGMLFPKQYIYLKLVENPELIMVIKYYLDNDHFTKQVALRITADYNPFRDYSYLAEQSRQKFGLDKFLDFK